jgi:hypothetical protein
MASTSKRPLLMTFVAFVLLCLGSTGLLANEFILGWGRAATLSFAAITVAGFAIFGYLCLASVPSKDQG